MEEKFGNDEHGSWVISTKYDGKPRKLYRRLCQRPMCGKWFLSPIHTDQKYCSIECRGLVKRSQKVIQCAFCSKYIYKRKSIIERANLKGSKLYCNRLCKERDQSLQGNNYRDKCFIFWKYYQPKISCNKCGYDLFEEMLDVHHIDGDRSNNNIDNLEPLCVWCHALITRKVSPHINNGIL